jgi:hypothetical protein
VISDRHPLGNIHREHMAQRTVIPNRQSRRFHIPIRKIDVYFSINPTVFPNHYPATPKDKWEESPYLDMATNVMTHRPEYGLNHDDSNNTPE